MPSVSRKEGKSLVPVKQVIEVTAPDKIKLEVRYKHFRADLYNKAQYTVESD
jgi:hypothetical protein